MSEQVSTQVTPARLFFADNLRTWLVVLVVLHHTSIVYAANTSFYYLQPLKGAFPALAAVFQLLNQAYFMGLLFFLAGYFTPSSFDRKGSAQFCKDRLIRLGIPLVLFIFVLGPLSSIGTYQIPTSLTHLPPLSWSQYPAMIGMGPLWFAALLLIFDGCYVLFRLVHRGVVGQTSWAPKFWAIAGFIVVLAVVSYFMRMAIPIATYVLKFPSLAYLPQYLSFFVIGTVASQHDWMRQVPTHYGTRGFIVALVAIVLLFLPSISAKLGSPAAFLGHGTWQSGLYALWDSVFSVCLSLALIVFFRRFFDHAKGLATFLKRNSFAVYVIHCPVIVAVALLLRPVALIAAPKFLLLVVIVLPVAFGVAYLVRRIPKVDKVF